VVPGALIRMITDPDTVKSQRAFQAMLQMKKFDIAALERTYAG
jgi:predicted 3-demethylubiquinone-9 3-methyltransferase (glyoxalase superfamily)